MDRGLSVWSWTSPLVGCFSFRHEKVFNDSSSLKGVVHLQNVKLLAAAGCQSEEFQTADWSWISLTNRKKCVLSFFFNRVKQGSFECCPPEQTPDRKLLGLT